MTMICPAKNKAELKWRLDHGVALIEPTPWGDKVHAANSLPVGFKEPVCLDPDTRRRFAQIEKLADGTWRVK